MKYITNYNEYEVFLLIIVNKKEYFLCQLEGVPLSNLIL